MKKTLILLLSSVLLNNLFANEIILLSAKQAQMINKFAEEQNLPKLDQGITITDKSPNFSQKLRDKDYLMREQLKNKGYMITNTDMPRWLENIKISGKSDIISSQKDNDLYDTNLKAHASNIKLAFPFRELPMISSSEIIGFGASGSWVNGWTGIVEIFNNKNLGICYYSINNMTLVHGSVQINRRSVRYDINNNPNTVSVEQGDNLAFLYQIDWYTNKNNHLYSQSLQCTTKAYNSETTVKLTELAREIEKFQLKQ